MWKTLLIGATLMLYSATVFAQPICHERNSAVETLHKNYDEHRIIVGAQSDGKLLEIFLNSKTRSWTILITHKEKDKLISCLVANGDAWNALMLAPMTPEF